MAKSSGELVKFWVLNVLRIILAFHNHESSSGLLGSFNRGEKAIGRPISIYDIYSFASVVERL